MGTNPEGRRDPGRKGDDPSSRPLSAVPPDPFAPSGTKVAPPPLTPTGTQPAMLKPPNVTSGGAPDSLGARGWQSISGMMEESEAEQVDQEVDQEVDYEDENEGDDFGEDTRSTGTPTSFDGSRQLPDPDEVLIHMTQHGETPVPRAREAAPANGTVSQNSSSEDGEGSSSSGSLHPRRAVRPGARGPLPRARSDRQGRHGQGLPRRARRARQAGCRQGPEPGLHPPPRPGEALPA
jgi:hypothetical protein